MPSEVTFFGLIFHTYGLIIGSAIVLAVWLVEKRLKSTLNSLPLEFWPLVYSALLGGVIGARAWHVATDFHLYRTNIVAAFYIWNGGLSILGGVAGGIFAVWLFLYIWSRRGKKVSLTLPEVLDAAVFGLPFAQAVGRFANYVNQELYGLPSTGIFKIYISPQNRFPGYSQVQYYHPLFFYEAAAMVLFGIGLWSWDAVIRRSAKKKQRLPVGTFTVWYLLYYGIVRFLLDFLRIDRPVVLAQLGVNQLVLAGMVVVLLFMLVKRKQV